MVQTNPVTPTAEPLGTMLPLPHQNHQEIMEIFHMLTGLLENLWFIIKQVKCSSFPTQELVFLGAQLNSKEITLTVPPVNYRCL